MAAAAAHGSVPCLILAREISGNITCKALAGIAARYGHTDCLRLLCEWGCFDSLVAIVAARYGQLECLKVAHALFPQHWDSVVVEAAIPHLPCLRYAHDTGLQLTRETMRRAAKKGALRCLRYLRAKGCDWGDRFVAACREQPKSLRYALRHGLELKEEDALEIIKTDNVDVLEVLLDRGCTATDECTTQVARFGSLAC